MHRTCLSAFVCACISLGVCACVRDFVSSEIVFTVTDREMLASQPVPMKTLRLWLMAPFNCGFAQMGLHLSQDPCCLHSDPQRRVIHQLSFVNVTFFFFLFLPLPRSQFVFPPRTLHYSSGRIHSSIYFIFYFFALLAHWRSFIYWFSPVSSFSALVQCFRFSLF